MKSLKLKALVLAVGLVAASLSTGASATGTIVATSDGYSFSGDNGLGGSFSDYLLISGANKDIIGTLSGSVGKIAGNGITFTDFDIVNSSFATVIDGTIFNGGKVGFGTFEGTTGAGSFFLHVAGTSIGAAHYAGTLSVTSAVPEPETYGMMLAGLGLMGFVARRRKSV